jgi:hypothetical protein
MKKFLSLAVCILFSGSILAQEKDTIILENGARIPCKIIEQNQINHSLRIVLPAGDTINYSNYKAFKRFDDLKYIYQQGKTRSPSGMAAASFLIPGLGQLMLGKPSGLLILTGWTICFATMLASAGPVFHALFIASPDDPDYHVRSGPFLIALAGGFSLRFCSAASAYHLAEIRNSREGNRNSASVSLLPYTGYPSPLTGNTIPVGLSIRISF